MCFLCDVGGVEDARHVIMQCSYQSDTRREMFEEICKVYSNFELIETFSVLLVRSIEEVELNTMRKIWKISCTYISKMY